MRAIILMMDSFGIGGAPDASEYQNLGANTLAHIASANSGLKIPNLQALGLCEAAKGACGEYPPIGVQPKTEFYIPSKYGHAKEISKDKDTGSGHWEMAGLPVLDGWGHFPSEYPSFPTSLIEAICEEGGIDGILANKAASGTEVIQEFGEEHIKTGKPIFYTSADSNIQIAAHEKYFGLEKLYQLCEIAFKYVKPYNIGRIIARPFVGEKKGEFTRTKNRHDYSVTPFAPTLLNKIEKMSGNVIAIGKISDIYAGSGVTKALKASGLEELWNVTIQEIDKAPDFSLIFTNFVDFDMNFGHRRDVKGYAEALEFFDAKLPEIVSHLKEDDVVFITADHGNDPTWSGTDHTREQVPVLMFGKKVVSENIGQRETFADIGQSIAHYFGLQPFDYGKSFL